VQQQALKKKLYQTHGLFQRKSNRFHSPHARYRNSGADAEHKP